MSTATCTYSSPSLGTVHIDAAPEVQVHVPVDVCRQLAEIEKELTNEKMALFERRYNNGFDLDVDPLYSRWKHLKDLADSQQDDFLSDTCMSDLEHLRQKTPSPSATPSTSTTKN